MFGFFTPLNYENLRYEVIANNSIRRGGKVIDLSKHIWEGWTVGDFIENKLWEFCSLYNQLDGKPFKTKEELKEWCKDLPYIKKHISGVYNYYLSFCKF